MTPETATSELALALKHAIRDIPDFPAPGIVFKDITPLLRDAPLFKQATEAMAAPFVGDGVTHVVGIESRGFILGAPVAQCLGAGFVPMRKPGKLPFRVERMQYALEYGADALEIHSDAFGSEHRVLIVDDVLATGGTASAACRVVEILGSTIIACSFLMVLSYLPGIEIMKGEGRSFATLLTY
ncbi:MAG: adenine phosphoribosyltransferase [Gemmatimonadaceae bacterium]